MIAQERKFLTKVIKTDHRVCTSLCPSGSAYAFSADRNQTLGRNLYFFIWTSFFFI